ncbi:hypothetical protein [Neorhizobium petrolearium]|uniref:hypothetical protein n=1 Tax=Neorhizobium petrolearium TaxID=515361 RepID=UPI003F7E04FE
MTEKQKPARRTTEEVLSEIIRPAKAILFLSRLLRWWPHAKRQEQGKFWIYKSRQEWCAELDIELPTFERYITTLRKGGWIETGAFPRFGSDKDPNGQKIQHVRPTDKLVNFVSEGTGRSIERPKKMGIGTGQPSPQKWGVPPLTNEGDPPSKMMDHKKENSSLSKSKQKKKHKGGTGLKTDTVPPVHSIFGKKEGNPSDHPESSPSPPKPPGSAKRFAVHKEPEDIANPLEHL